MIAFICASPVQVMRAVHMKMNFCQEEADIYILYKCPGYESIYANLNKINLFKNAYKIDAYRQKKRIVFHLLFGKNQYAKIIKSKNYNKIFGFNIEDELTQALYILNKNNPGFEYHCVEDGPNIYNLYEPIPYKWYHPYKWLAFDKQAYHMTAFWTSCPEFMQIPKNFKTKKMRLPTIDGNDQNYKNIINKVFQYEPSEKLEKADILIMDESHYEDGLMINNADFQLYKKIKNKYSNKNILVKMHPRTKHNRYLKEFNIMEKTDIPWELYVLNLDSEKKKKLIQISIVCGTMVSDRFMFGIEGKKIILAPMFYDKVKNTLNGVPRISQYETNNYEKIKAQYKDPAHFVIAYSEDELFKALDNMFQNN